MLAAHTGKDLARRTSLSADYILEPLTTDMPAISEQAVQSEGANRLSGGANRTEQTLMAAVRKFLAGCLLVVAAVSGSVSIGLFVLTPAGWIRAYEPKWPVAAMLCWDAVLLLLFFLQHSVMVRRGLRARLARFIPPWSYPAVYCIASSIVLATVVVFWQPTGRYLLVCEGFTLQIVNGVALLAVALFFWGAIALRGFDPFGLSPIRAHLRDREEPRPAFVVKGPYRWVRHPLYFSILLLVWFSPDLTLDRLLANILWTAWIWLATRWEERDLESDFGEAYRQYQKRVPMLIPWGVDKGAQI